MGFSAAAQVLDPEQLRQAQREFFSLVATAVINAEGTVAKRIGDAVVAVFGAPVAHENDPYRAVRAGLDVQASLDGLSLEGQLLPDGRPLVARVGVATGEAMVTFEPGRDEPRIAGEVLARAMAKQAAAPPGGVLVGEVTQRVTAGTIDYDPGPDGTFLATGLKKRPGRFDDRLPLVGREPELGLLVSCLRRAISERRGQLVTVVGEPGLGKSRLTRALAEHIDSPATPTLVRWRVGSCLPYGEGVSYSALGQVVKAQAGILDSDPAPVARQRLHASVDGLLGRSGDAELVAQVKARLEALLGLPGASTPVGEDVAQSHAAWRRYVLALAEDGPTVLVLEDLQWADDGFLDFLRSLVDTAASAPLVVLATTRPELLERRPEWVAGLGDAMTITLVPLSEAETGTVVTRLLGDAVLPDPLRSRLLDLVAGNPLYAEEYVRMLLDSGVLRTSEQDLLADLPLPDTVQGVVNSRLDLLSAAERSVVSAAAVVGEVFWVGAVAAVADADREDVLACLEALEQREVVRRLPASTMAGESEFAFRHVLVRDAAYARIPRSARVLQHTRCAQWLDAVAAESGDDVAEMRAHHRSTAYELAAVIGLELEPYADPARQALTGAAERALRLHAVSAAHAFARRAVMLWYGREDEVPALHAVLLAAEMSFLDDPHAFYADGGPALLQRTADTLLAQGDRSAAAKAHLLLGQAEWYRGSGAEVAAAALSRAVDLLAEEPASEMSASALAELGRLRMLSHQYGEAIALSDRAAAVARSLGLLEVEANALVTAGTARYSVGDPLGLVQQEQALELCRAHGLRALQRAANNLAATMQEEGRLRRSYDLIDESAHASRGWGLSLTTRADDSEKALMAWYDGDWVALLDHTATFRAGAGPEAQQWESHLLALEGIVRVLRDEPMPAELASVVDRARQSGFPAMVRSALAHLGCCRFLQGRRDEAARLFDELLEHTEGMQRGSAREWLYSAVLLASFLGEGRVEVMEDRLLAMRPHTPWVRGALRIAQSLLAEDAGKHHDAADHAARAVTTYQRIGDATSTVFARARLANSAYRAGDLLRAREEKAQVLDFVQRNGAVVLAAYLPPDD